MTAIRVVLPAILGALLMAACGTDPGDRAASAGGMGLVGGAVVGGPVGAVIGGAGGAMVGATTNPKSVNLGKPVWD